MLICAAGDIHGALDQLYADVLAFERELGVRFDHVLHVGDFGIWPDPERVDKATRKHEGAGDFPAWLAEGRAAPRSTIFIKGNHEDFVWLDNRPDDRALPGLRYLRNGMAIEIEGPDGAVRVGGIGGCFGPSDYERRTRNLQGYARRHYTREDVEALCAYFADGDHLFRAMAIGRSGHHDRSEATHGCRVTGWEHPFDERDPLARGGGPGTGCGRRWRRRGWGLRGSRASAWGRAGW